MYLKRNVLDLYFYFGVIIFTLGKTFNSYFLDFYLYFNIFGLFILILSLLDSRVVKLNFSYLMISGLLLYLLGNLIFISDIELWIIKLSDLFFIFQIIIKQVSFSIIYHNLSINRLLRSILTFNLFVLLLSVILSKFSSIGVIDLFYFLESLISMIAIVYFNFCFNNIYLNSDFIDVDFLFIGQVLWLVGDLFYSDFNLKNMYILGDISDLVYFAGFYFFVKSINSLGLRPNFNIVKRFI